MSDVSIAPIEANAIIVQNLSITTRVRLLFQREIEIDAMSESRVFDTNYLIRLLEIKKSVDSQMVKSLASASGATFLLYLIGKGMDPALPILGLKVTSVPGVLVFIALYSSYATALAAYSFFNSQTYSALIDQVILKEAKNGIFDVDMIKASYEAEWLIFKALRKDFSFHTSVHINYQKAGRIISLLAFTTMSFVTMMPFIALIFAVPYMSATFLENDIIGMMTKAFIFLCSASVVFLIISATFGFNCKVALGVDYKSKPV